MLRIENDREYGGHYDVRTLTPSSKTQAETGMGFRMLVLMPLTDVAQMSADHLDGIELLIIAPGCVAGGKIFFVVANLAPRQATGDRPDTARVQCFEEHRVRQKTCYATVAVQKRVNPYKAAMRSRQNGIRLTQSPVHLRKTL